MYFPGKIQPRASQVILDYSMWLYKLERILMQQIDLKSALNSKEILEKDFIIKSFKNANTVLGN